MKSNRTKLNKRANAISVLICDDNTLVREGLRGLLESAGDIEVAGEVANGRRAVREAKRLLADVVLLDVSMPQLNGMEAALQIAREVPSSKVLILSAHTDEHYVQRAVEVGASGFLMKGLCSRDLLPAIRATARGNTFFCPAVPRRLLRRWQDRSLEVCPNSAKADPYSPGHRDHCGSGAAHFGPKANLSGRSAEAARKLRRPDAP